jgi:hypothetical protein
MALREAGGYLPLCTLFVQQLCVPSAVSNQGGAYGARHSATDSPCREMLFLCPFDGSESVETAGWEASIRGFISVLLTGRSYSKIR